MTRFDRVVVLGAAGGLGRALSPIFVDDGSSVTGVDLAPRPPSNVGEWIAADATAPDTDLESTVRGTDLLVVALPEAAAFGALEALAGHLHERALLVDTMSVKSPVEAWAAGSDCRAGILSINPLFAPDLGLRGRLVAAVSIRPGSGQGGFVELLERAGAHVLAMTADEHDRDTAATQALTHAAALAVARALARHPDGPAPRTVTPPHRALVLVAGRILSGSPSVYWAIQQANPHARAVRRLLIESAAEIDAIVDADDEAGFVRLLEGLRDGFGPGFGQLAEDGAAMMASVPIRSTGRTDRV